MDDGNRVAQFHHVVHEHFDEIDAGGFEFDVAKNHHSGGGVRGVAQFEFRFRLANDRRLVGRDEADVFIESSKSGRPAVEDTQARSNNRQLRHANKIEDADEKEISIGFLPHFFTEQG